MFPVSEDDNILSDDENEGTDRLERTNVGGALHFRLDESQQVFLVHTAGVVDVGIDLANVIKVPRIRKMRKITNGVVERNKIPMRDFLLKLREPMTEITKVQRSPSCRKLPGTRSGGSTCRICSLGIAIAGMRDSW